MHRVSSGYTDIAALSSGPGGNAIVVLV